MESIFEEKTKFSLTHMIDRRNYKSAHTHYANESILILYYTKEVSNDLILPIPVKYLPTSKEASVIPIEVCTQFTIDSEGNRRIKRITIHSASFTPPSNKSVNNQILRELLTES